MQSRRKRPPSFPRSVKRRLEWVRSCSSKTRPRSALSITPDDLGPARPDPGGESTGARCSVNMMSAVSPRGDFHFMLTEGRVNSDVFIEYCQCLVHDNPGRPVFLVVDGHSSHKSKKAKEWVQSMEGQIKIFYVPSYSPAEPRRMGLAERQERPDQKGRNHEP